MTKLANLLAMGYEHKDLAAIWCVGHMMELQEKGLVTPGGYQLSAAGKLLFRNTVVAGFVPFQEDVLEFLNETMSAKKPPASAKMSRAEAIKAVVGILETEFGELPREGASDDG